MRLVFLDSSTLGTDIDLSPLESLGGLISYPTTSESEIIPRINNCDVLIVNKVVITPAVIDAAKSLKLICVAATGTNNVDIEYANSKGIEVKNVVDYSTDSVAQVTFGSLLALINNVEYYNNYVMSGEYSDSLIFTNNRFPFFELKGKQFGIIGMGNIGKKVASIASAFGAIVNYYPTSGVAHCKDYESVGLNELLGKSDIISIHAPLNQKTNNLIAMPQFKLMKPSAIVVNMGRGGIVNEADLATAIDFDLISGAVVDVFTKEPLENENPLLSIKKREKVIFSPHIGWASKEARERLILKIRDNILSIK